MDAFLQQFQHLEIQLEEITSATNNFDDKNNCIGGGGFGKVYKGEVSHSKGRSMVAIKRLNPKNGQGIPEFLKEITTLSRYKHENLISLLGFCYQRNEIILVYEYASRGSLDRYLNSPHLSWLQRLKICLDVARGLCYLHDPRQAHQRLIHCDMKSANILLDDHWNAKLSDFGLSIMGSANEQHSVVVTNPAGTYGYCDPQYVMTNTLTKKSDVYSFGVVLFEVLCGRLCCTYSNGRLQQVLVPKWIECYTHKKLDEIIFKSPTIQPMDHIALKNFSDIAYRCLKESREERPPMVKVVTELETALEIQEFGGWEPLFDYEEMIRSAEPPLNYGSKGELRRLLSLGVLLNSGKTWFSLNKEEEHYEMIFFPECLNSGPSEIRRNRWSYEYKSRFSVIPYHYNNGSVQTRVKAQFLTPLITYTVNLVFKFSILNVAKRCELISLNYKLQGETENTTSYLAYQRVGGWWWCELYQLTSDNRFVELEILFEGFNFNHGYITVEGIEFRPLEKVEHKDENQPISDSDANWEENLPTDYEEIIKWSKNSVQWTTKKEAYSIIRKGFFIDDGKKWFSCDTNGKKCHILSAREAGISDPHWISIPESRFKEGIECILWGLRILTTIQSKLVSSKTTYASYLIYKLPEDESGFEVPILVEDQEDRSGSHSYICVVSPQTPVIRPKAGHNTHNPVNMRKIKGLPQQRKDGWMEVQVWEFRTPNTAEMIHMNLSLTTCGAKKYLKIIVQGLEFRPI